ncbi:uncharacterized protein LOC122650941 [Telopea speciosissima]|uniref:uncharacterized protein LOC122650941 n=1 Tax=Telopea speciosissima TaxID=54955 RepID=UPI001CC44F2D|nr:uncharacterized protein LOC122650941 [Telopea speciosissima]
MMAVSLPNDGPKSFNSNMKIDNDLCIFRPEDCPRSISKGSIDKIRETMRKHEALFREQVQALHKLYSIQKLAMQEITQRIDVHVQLLTFSSNNVSVHNGQLHGAVGEKKHLRPSCISTQACRAGSTILSLNPICAVQEVTGCGPKTLTWMNATEVKEFPSGQTKPRIEIDLERPPEDYLEDSESKVEANSYAMLSNTNLLEGTKTNEVSFRESNLSVPHADSLSLKRRDPDKDFSTLAESMQQMHQDCVRAQESKSYGIDMNKCSSGIYSLQEGFHKNILRNFLWNDLPAVGNPSINVEPILSSNHQAGKLVHLRQGSLVVTAQRFNSLDSVSSKPREHVGSTLELAKGCIDLASPQIYQPTEIGSSFLTPDLKKDKHHQQKDSTGEDLTSQTSDDGGSNNLNISSHGSNSIESHGVDVCNDGNLSTLTISSSPKLVGECAEPIHMNKVKTGGVQSELKESVWLRNSIETSHASSISDSEANHMDHSNCSNGNPETVASHKQPVVTRSNEEPKNEATIEEISENVAAKILLSLAPYKSLDEDSSHAHVKAEIDRSSLDVESEEKQNLLEERVINNGNVGIEDETLDPTKFIHERRTSRRP